MCLYTRTLNGQVLQWYPYNLQRVNSHLTLTLTQSLVWFPSIHLPSHDETLTGTVMSSTILLSQPWVSTAPSPLNISLIPLYILLTLDLQSPNPTMICVLCLSRTSAVLSFSPPSMNPCKLWLCTCISCTHTYINLKFKVPWCMNMGIGLTSHRGTVGNGSRIVTPALYVWCVVCIQTDTYVRT